MNKPVVFTGNNVLQSHVEILQPVELYALYERIRGDQDLKSETERLRKVALMDKAAYQRVKTRLPYFCCAKFENGLRKGDQFESVTCFVMDIDKLEASMMASLKSELCQDPRAKMLFVSPGGQGIKVVFELAEPCSSLKDYSDFYRTFAFHIAETYKIQQYLDTSTCDATRVTFLCHDEGAWYNTMNQQVRLHDFLPSDIFTTYEVKDETVSAPDAKKEELPEELYKEILLKLNPDARITGRKKQIFVPEALNQIEDPVRAEFIKLGIVVREIRDINYGKKFVIEMGFRFGEINLFYGSRGFSVVQSAKSGSDQKLNSIGELVIRKVLAEGVKQSISEAEAAFTMN